MDNASFTDFLTNQLNDQQRKAVKQTTGTLLVVAGAGSGKTRVITARITYLIKNKLVDPSSILALTFTNKAAHEMKERIIRFLGPTISLPFIGTFHSYCLRLLKQYRHRLDLPHFSILDNDDQQKLINVIVKRHGLGKQLALKQIVYRISLLKNQAIQPHDTKNIQNQLLHDIYQAYEQEKKVSNCLDFDDLLLETVKLLKTSKEFKQFMNNTIRHILIDEYQDTNAVQHKLLKQLSCNEKQECIADSICVVGDEDQSIYSWRGATVTNILNFKNDFPQTKTIKIEQNYRSAQSILDVANHVIKHNTNRNPKNLWSTKNGSNRICILQCLSEYQEADAIAQLIKITHEHNTNNDTALLYRAHFQSRALEEALIKQSIPYKIVSGIQFYERKEIKDMLAYLRLIVNPFDRAAFFRVINCPSRGLGEQFEALFYEQWNEQPLLTFKQLAQKLISENALPNIKKTSLDQFVSLFDVLGHDQKPSAAIEHIIHEIQYFTHLKKQYDEEESSSRIENLKELIHAMNHFESNNIDTITSFLDEVALMQEKKTIKQEEQTPVLLMTLHAAKGLEFDTAIITGLNEGILPSTRSSTTDDDLEEERRLFYVGITRARERLLITRTQYRYTFGQMSDQLPSRFLKEIPKSLAPIHDCAYLNSSQLQTLFMNWLDIKNKQQIQTFATKQTKEHDNIIGIWKKNQPVSHPKFGIGIIQKIEQKTNNNHYLTVKFRSCTKKIDAQFLKRV